MALETPFVGEVVLWFTQIIIDLSSYFEREISFQNNAAWENLWVLSLWWNIEQGKKVWWMMLLPTTLKIRGN